MHILFILDLFQECKSILKQRNIIFMYDIFLVQSYF